MTRKTRAMVLTLGLLLTSIGFEPAIGQSCDPNVVDPTFIEVDNFVASWTVLNNSFSPRFNKTKPHPQGVLFQIGSYDVQGSDPNNFKVVIHRATGSPQVLRPADFKWLDIVSLDGQNKPGWPGPSKVVPLKKNEECSLAPGLCNATPDSCKTLESVLDPSQRECLRRRSLHKEFTPLSILTFWAGPDGYCMDAAPYPQDPNSMANHFQYRFMLKNKVTLYKDGIKQSDTPRLQKIVITHYGEHRHHDNEEPPWPSP